MPDKDTAKKDVASSICLNLKKMGELTKENLLPVDHRMKCSNFDQDEDEKTAEGTRKNRACYTRNVSLLLNFLKIKFRVSSHVSKFEYNNSRKI